MHRWLRRASVTSAVAAVAVGTLLAPVALACPPILPGAREAQAVYGQKITHIGPTRASALLGTVHLGLAATAAKPSTKTFSATLTRNPDTNNAPAFLTPADACAKPSCVELPQPR